MTALHDLTAVQQAAAVRAGEVSPVELAEHYLARVDRYDARYGAFVTVTADAALAAAAQVEAAVVRARGSGEAGSLPPLAGVPVGIKDLASTAGVRTTFGSALFADHVPDEDDDAVALLRAAGTVSLGKTNTPEFGLPAYTEPDVAPPARTPWDERYSAGGSSGGSAAAVAAGLVAVAHGNDGGGSVRTPASVCGLAGLKPGRGVVSGGPRHADVAGLATAGVLARTVADAAALLDAMSGAAIGAPYPGPPVPPLGSLLAHASREPGRLRVGRWAEPLLAPVGVDPACLAAWESASALLADLGHDVEDVPAPLPTGLVPAFEVVWTALAASVPLPAHAVPTLRPLTRWLRDRGATVSGAALLQALGEMRSAAGAALRRCAAYDLLLSPTLAGSPLPVGALRDDADPAADFAAQKAWNPFSAAYNVTGQPAITLPLARTDAGLPVGVTLAARPGEEWRLVEAAAALERAAPWAGRHPDCW
jgi:amidase